MPRLISRHLTFACLRSLNERASRPAEEAGPAAQRRAEIPIPVEGASAASPAPAASNGGGDGGADGEALPAAAKMLRALDKKLRQARWACS